MSVEHDATAVVHNDCMWSCRDTAVSRKNVAEVELARGRIEVMQVR